MRTRSSISMVGDDFRNDFERKISYGDLRTAVARAAGAWLALGLKTGDRVVVFAPDGIEYVTAYLGAIWAGGAAIGVNPRLPLADLAPILTDSEVRFIWSAPDQASGLQALAATLPQVLTVVTDNAAGWRAACAGATVAPPVMRAHPTSRQDQQHECSPSWSARRPERPGVADAQPRWQRQGERAARREGRPRGRGRSDRGPARLRERPRQVPEGAPEEAVTRSG